jgi:hypothetical protein
MFTQMKAKCLPVAKIVVIDHSWQLFGADLAAMVEPG